MDVAIGKRWEPFVDTLVRDGRYASAAEVVSEGLRMVSEREASRSALRDELALAIADDVWLTDEEVGVSVGATFEQLKTEGY